MHAKASLTGSSTHPCEKAGDSAGFCFPSLGEMKVRHRPSVPKAIVAGLRGPAMAPCCRDLLSRCSLPANTDEMSSFTPLRSLYSVYRGDCTTGPLTMKPKRGSGGL